MVAMNSATRIPDFSLLLSRSRARARARAVSLLHFPSRTRTVALSLEGNLGR
jgi:hypothetical protein